VAADAPAPFGCRAMSCRWFTIAKAIIATTGPIVATVRPGSQSRACRAASAAQATDDTGRRCSSPKAGRESVIGPSALALRERGRTADQSSRHTEGRASPRPPGMRSTPRAARTYSQGMAGLDDREPLSWRIPPIQPAALFLVVCGCAALNIYAHPASGVRGLTIVLGVACLAAGLTAMRMYLVADQDGVYLRFIRSEVSLPWSQIQRVEAVSGVRGASTVRFVRHDGTYVDVPPSLLQPATPTSRPRAMAQLNGVVHRLEELRATRRS